MQWLQNTQKQNQITPYQTKSSIKRSRTRNSDIRNSEKLHDNHQSLEQKQNHSQGHSILSYSVFVNSLRRLKDISRIKTTILRHL